MSDHGTQYCFCDPSSGHETVYKLRGLRDDEIDAWTQFCESVFAYKLPHPPPASYFARHFYNDPYQDASLVRVAMQGQAIVASCRVFRRTIISPVTGSPVTAGGIGEVCTHADHRRRGLSSQLLQQAISAMKHNSMAISLLHSAPTFFPVYEKAGYTSIRSRWSVVTISTQQGTHAVLQKGDEIRTAQFPEDTVTLQKLHKEYSESKRLSGCIVRSEAYWNDYIANELGDSLFLILRGGRIVSWMSVRYKAGRYQLREFGCAKDAERVLYPLLLRCLKDFQLLESDTVELCLPTTVLEDLQSQAGGDTIPWIHNVTAEDDLGWMYKNLEGEKDESSTIQFDASNEHLIWPSDSF